MIHLTCDKCEKALEVPDDLAGKKVKCPACGDVNVVPAAVAAAATSAAAPIPVVAVPNRPDRAAAAGYPPAAGPEERVMKVRKAMLRSRPGLSLLLFLGLLGGIAGAIWFGAVAATTNTTLAAACGGVSVLILLFLAGWKVLSLGEAMEITTKRTIERNGLLSKATTEVMHRDIRNVQIRQSFRDRLLGIGEIQISSAADDESEIVVRAIPSPKRLREVIDLYRPM